MRLDLISFSCSVSSFFSSFVKDSFLSCFAFLRASDLLTSVADVLVVAVEEDELVRAIEGLLEALVAGTITAPKFDAEVKVVEVTNAVEAIINSFIEENELLTTIFDQVEVLYEDSKLVDIAETTKKLDVDAVIESLKAILEKADAVGINVQTTLGKAFDL